MLLHYRTRLAIMPVLWSGRPANIPRHVKAQESLGKCRAFAPCYTSARRFLDSYVWGVQNAKTVLSTRYVRGQMYETRANCRSKFTRAPDARLLEAVFFDLVLSRAFKPRMRTIVHGDCFRLLCAALGRGGKLVGMKRQHFTIFISKQLSSL